MLYFRDSKVKYKTKYIHAWRLNDNGTVDHRDDVDGGWNPARILTSGRHIEDSLFRGDIEICDNPFNEYDYPNDN